MQVYRTLHQLLLVTLLVFASGCATATQNQTASADFSQAELDQMLAPIALYPDSVLTHVLIAATYPLEVVQAARWLEQNPRLSGEAAVDAASGQDWDPSVQALVAFPQLLKRLNEDLTWTQQLGEAFISDEPALLASIQRLRQRAYAQGSLNKMEHVVVEREREIIVIEPARREVIYVPYYDTRVVYGNWWWPAYPPVYWYEPVGYRSHVTFYWGTGFHIRPSFYFSVFDWHRRHVVVHHHYYHQPPRYYPRRHHFQHASRWQHDHYHRRGVHYQHSKLRDRQDFYHSRPDQRRTSPARTTEHQREWRAEQSRSGNGQQRPGQDRQAQQQNRTEQNSGLPSSRRMQEAERAQRQLREAQFSERQRNVQQRQQASESRQQTAPVGRIAQQWAENEQRMQPILPAATEQDRSSNRRLQQEQRAQPVSRPQQEQRAQPVSRPQQEQRAQPVSRPQQEQRA
ncbi:DUF3300 domain-containing protein, partial [Alishewanella longhuensis]|uniref:DUF3300 domain-containing protein n=1 Tax=Alishewanella longhuensis TaxID=1091037 RepID=UPI00167C053B